MRSNGNDAADRAATQLIETTALLGVDFVPVGQHAPCPECPADPAGQERSVPEVGDKQQRLERLREQYEAEMPPAPGAPHTRIVWGTGNPGADLVFIGEAPGAEEDRTGVPFVGRAGRKLDDMIAAMGLTRDEVYIANVLKRRPPGNATPTPQEAEEHGPWLRRQIEIIEPRVIVTLGKPAANYLLGSRESMSRMRGHWYDFHGIPVMPTFHPAFLLRQYTTENRKKVWSDLQQAMARLRNDPKVAPTA